MDDESYTQAERRQGADRRRRRGYRFNDWRSGFDRRVNGTDPGAFQRALAALRDQPKALVGLLVAVNLLNIADFALTLVALDSGGREVNPILRPLFSISPFWAGVFKLVAVLAASLLVWEARRYRKALIAGLCMFAVFAGVLVYHLVSLAFSTGRTY